jgi:hypothetical protein
MRYVNLLDNPERYTGYSGKAAHKIWDSIYKENCFEYVYMPVMYLCSNELIIRSLFQYRPSF